MEKNKLYDTLKSKVQKLDANPLYLIWGKYYLREIIPPKNFSSCFPQLSKYISTIQFTPVKKALFLKCIKDVNTKAQLQKQLISLFGIDQQIIPEFILIFHDVGKIEFTKNAKKSIKSIFYFTMRYLIMINHHFSEIVQGALSGNQSSLLIFKNLSSMSSFFSQFSEEYLNDFFQIFDQLLQSFSTNHQKLFKNSSPIQTQSFDFILSLFQFLNSKIEQSSKVFIMSNTIKYFGLILSTNSSATWSTSIFIVIKSFLTTISFNIGLLTNEDFIYIFPNVAEILISVPKAENIGRDEKYQIGILSLRVFERCVSNIHNSKVFESYLSNLHEFIIWVIKNFSFDVLKYDNSIENIERKNLTELGNIGLTEYLNRNPILMCENPLDEILQQGKIFEPAKLVVTIVENLDDPIIILRNLFNTCNDTEKLLGLNDYQIYVSFILYVISSFSEGVLSKLFDDNWERLILPSFFSIENLDKTLKSIRNVILKIMLNCFINSDSSRVKILDSIAKYITQRDIECLDLFIIYFNSLLMTDAETSFGKFLIQSSLLSIIIEFSKVNLEYFDFIRNFIARHPIYTFQSNIVNNFLFDVFYDEIRRNSVFECYDIALSIQSNEKEAHDALINIIKNVTVFIKKLLNEKSDFSLNFFEMISNKVSDYPNDIIIQMNSNLETFKTCAQIPIILPNLFSKCIQLFTKMLKSSEMLFNILTKRDSLYIEELKNACILHKEGIDTVDCLFDFLLCSDNKNQTYSLIKNRIAIDLILKRAEGANDEKEILEKISLVLFYSLENIYAFESADVIEFIMRRLTKVKDLKLINSFLELYQLIASSSFTNKTFYTTINLLKSPEFRYPHILFETLNRVLTNSSHEHGPSSYFYFSGNETGIFGPKIDLGDSFSFVTSFRIDNFVSTSKNPLVGFKQDKGTYLVFFFDDQQIKAQISDTKTTQNYEFKYIFAPKKWYSLIIIVDQKSVSLYVNGEQIEKFSNAISFSLNKSEISICSFDKNYLSANIATTFILNCIDFNMISQMISDKIPMQLKPYILCNYIPKIAKHDSCIYVTPEIRSVPLKGKPIPYATSASLVLSSPASVPILFPLFTRLFGCEQCKDTQTECLNCGSLSTKDGIHYILLILDMFIELYEISNSFGSLLLNIQAFKLLNYILSNLRKDYFDTNVIHKLLNMYSKFSKDEELSKQMTESIWLNLELITNFDEDIQMDYFLTLSEAFSINKEGFLKSNSIEATVYMILVHKWPSKTQILASQFLSILLSESMTYTLAMSFIAISYYMENPQVLDLIISIFLNLINQKNQNLLKNLEIFNFYFPFIPFFSIPYCDVQWKSLQCIMRICNKTIIKNAVILAVISFVPGENERKFAEYIQHLFISHDKVVDSSYLPLYIKVIDDEKFDNFLQKDLTEIKQLDYWYYWLFLKKVIPVEIFANLIKNEKEILDIFDFLDVYSCEKNIDLTDYKKELLIKLLQKNKLTKEILMVSLHFIFGSTIKPIKNDEVKYLQKNLNLFSSNSLTRKYFNLRVENNELKDFDLIMLLCNAFSSKQCDFEVSLTDTYTIHSYVIFAYLSHIIEKFHPEIQMSVLFNDFLTNCGIHTAYQISSILNSKTSEFNKYLNVFNDDMDSNEYQIFLFEEQFSNYFNKLNPFTSKFRNYIYQSLSVLDKIDVIKDVNNSHELCFKINQAEFSLLENLYNGFISSQQLQINTEKAQNIRIYNNFIRTLEIGCSPWSIKSNTIIHYKMSNYITQKGKRILLSIKNESQNNINNEKAVQINPLKNNNSQVKRYPVKRISKTKIFKGQIIAYENSLMFYSSTENGINQISLSYSRIIFIFKRTYHKEPSIEIFTFQNKSFYFIFDDNKNLNNLLKYLEKQFKNLVVRKSKKYNFFIEMRNINNSVIQKLTPSELFKKSSICNRWQNCKISNYEFIYYINIIFGRTFNDLDQYPIFPILSKNVKSSDFTQQITFPNHKLICVTFNRIEPFATQFSQLYSKEDTNVKIGVPELYTLPQIFKNENNFDFTKDMELPDWAESNFHYSSYCLRSLESKITSKNLRKWIENAFNNLSIDQKHRKFKKEFIPQTYFVNKIIEIQKQFAHCENKLLIDTRTTTPKEIIIPESISGKMLCASKNFDLIVFGTKFDNYISIFNIETQKVTQFTHEISFINCATIIGGLYLLTGGGDSSVRVLKLPSLRVLHISSFHTEPITYVTGNAEVGLVVSLDRNFILTLENLHNGKLIRSIQMEESKSAPFIEVFKSGCLAYVKPDQDISKVYVYDQRGEKINEFEVKGKVVRTDKMQLQFSVDVLALGIEESKTIVLYDVLTCKVIQTIEDVIPEQFCTINSLQSVLAISGSIGSYFFIEMPKE